MISNSVFSLPFFWVLERLLILAIFFYLVFSVLVVRQVGLLISTVKTTFSRPILVLSVLHLVIGLMCVIAALALVFR